MSKTATAAKATPAPTATATTGAAQTNTANTGNAGDAKAAEQPAPRKDPFEGVPTLTIGEASNVLDLSKVKASPAYKYAKAVEEAAALRLPIQKGWKHAAVMFIPGTNKGGENGFKPGSVHGDVADIVKRAGKSGIAAYELVTELRRRQTGNNKRSKYCEALPPVGWAEGWINSAVTRSIVGIHATKKAPMLQVPVAEKGTEATDAQNKANAALTDQSKAA